VLLGGALYVLVLTFAQIDAQHQLLSLAEVLGDVVDELIALADLLNKEVAFLREE
jgi:hypothetical protein